MKVGIQILNYNGMRWLPQLLQSLKENSLESQHIYVVDNASTDCSLDWIEQNHPDVTIIRHDRNLGYAEAYNRAIPQAFADGCDWVCLQNTDTIVCRNWLLPLEAAGEDQSIGIMGPMFLEWESDTPNYYMRGRCADLIDGMFETHHRPADRDWVEGSSMFIRRDCFEQVGGLNPLYFMYWEEADYCRRARSLGWRVVAVSGSLCRHFAGGSADSSQPGFLQLRNHFIYKLTDPFHGFLRNSAAAARLALTYLKERIIRTPDIRGLGRLIHAMGSAIGNVRRCYDSWHRSRTTHLRHHSRMTQISLT